jgi:hypothetical protein
MPHDRLRNAQRHDLCVCDASLGGLRLLKQGIVAVTLKAIGSTARSASIEAPFGRAAGY